MENPARNDPFLWDVETVVERLCAPGCPWARDASALASKVKEEEMDGKTLLTFEHLCSRQELLDCLGIRVARHKAAFLEAIHDMRYASPSYQTWLRTYMRKREDASENQELGTTSTQPLPLYMRSTISEATRNPTEGSSLTAFLNPVMGVSSNEASNGPLPAEPGDQQANPSEISMLPQGVASKVDKVTDALPAPTADIKADDGGVDERPVKRKRIAPVNLTSTPLHSIAVRLPTEADHLTTMHASDHVQQSTTEFPWEESSANAYLGNGSLALTTIKSSSDPTSSQVVLIDEDQFTISANGTIPPGRRSVVNRAMRRLFMETSRKEKLFEQGLAIRSSTPSDDSDPILDLDDLPDEFDEQTLREIEAERMDMERLERAQAEKYLTQERVKEILDSAITSFGSAWQDVKLPKYQRKAYRIWHSAIRLGMRKLEILKARQEAQFYDLRIKKLRDGIMREKWTKESEVRIQAGSLEQSVEDKLYRLWLLEILESKVEPPKPSRVTQITAPAVERPSAQSDEELLSSEEEEDDFIVPDSPPDVDSAMDFQFDDESERKAEILERSMKPNLSVHVDLTQLTPTKMAMHNTRRIEIDLTSPIRPPDAKTSPSPGNSRQVDDANDIFPMDLQAADCGAQTGSYWAKEQKRWHLVLCLLWKLPQARRSPILQLVKDKSHGQVWDATIQRHITSPIKETELGKDQEATAAFDLTRIFVSFIKVKNYKESRIAELSERHVRKILAERDSTFPHFCSFISGMSSQFPKDSQIYRADAFDEDVDDDVFDDDTPARGQTTPSKNRKGLAKEIIQNKDALDMREREMRRAEEQRSRRANLRAKLAMSSGFPVDKSRLIINESKQENQGLIYVNEEIGKRIKDHQIEGVRFLWNQIVLDPDIRQGCLLAHTMGLGKTMQVITFLVAIAESVISSDATIQDQIPDCLRESKTLVLCPAGLVDNWIDEFLMWAPAGLLGDLQKIDSSMTENTERFSVIRRWDEKGGVLVIGYPMFQKVSVADETIQTILTDKPNIVVADEAHYLKSPETKISRACSQFRTMSRIALTGSPLANNVEEYHSMIDWVAPNFLGPSTEFREIYAKPIHRGLWTDSERSDKRKALKMLQVLKETVAPKVHRATIKSCLKNDLPPKFEFVISVAPTVMQQRLYELYVEAVGPRGDVPQAQIFNIANDLALICNHPRCFRQKVHELNAPRDKGHGERENEGFPVALTSAFLKEMNVPDLSNISLSRKVEFLVKILDEAREIGDKVLIFSQSLLTMDYFMNLFRMQKRRVQRLDGSTAISSRQDMVKEFNRGAHDVYVISTRAGGVGLNIQGANRIVIFDFKWNPVNEQQAIGRAYRIGQQKPVYVYRFVVAGTFEENLHNKAVFKTQLASRVVDQKNPISWSKQLGSILHPIKKRPVEDVSAFKGKDAILDKLIEQQTPNSIHSIVSTDTFEEEDPTVNLTTEERREAQNLVQMNRLRLTDPDEYRRLKDQEQQQQVALLRQSLPSSYQVMPGQTASPMSAWPSTQPARPSYGMDGAYDVLYAPSSQPVAAANSPVPSPSSYIPTVTGVSTSVSTTTAIPLPMIAGANTFFRQQQSTTAEPQERSVAREPAPEKSVSAFGSVFSSSSAQARTDFQAKLIAKLQSLQETLGPVVNGSFQSFADGLATSIDDIRKDRAFGFLPDMQHWKLLTEFLSKDRLVHAMNMGLVTGSFLALASREELERRIETLDGLPESAFHHRLSGEVRDPEPQNLGNIRRARLRPPEAGISKQARDDMKVMREAADKRRQRSTQHLPSWASRALSDAGVREPLGRVTDNKDGGQ